jgi:phosphoribosylformimino-5-aminoimidazole carboxamide ribotide isomerase
MGIIHIWPAIDVLDGQCVRLQQGDYNIRRTYYKDPLEVAKQFEDAGLTRLHLVDLDGARGDRVVNWRALQDIARHTSLTIEFGGGLKQDADVRSAFEAGAHRVIGGSVAAREPERFLKWISLYGADRVVLGADARDGNVLVAGWLQKTKINVFDYIAGHVQNGVATVICTDTARDGMLEGPSFDLYKELKNRFPSIELIASGGIGSIRDLDVLEGYGLEGVIIGKALYEDRITLKQLSDYTT